MKITITDKNGTQEYDFDENSILLTDERERIFKENGKWYITKLIGNDFTKWVEETQPTIIEDKKIEPIEWNVDNDNCQIYYNGAMNYVSRAELELALKINEIIDYIQEK